jgi:hypothetical protein
VGGAARTGTRAAALLACALIAVALGATAAHAQTAADEACARSSPSAAVCTGGQKLAEAAAAECRRIGLPEESCALPLGHQVSTKVVRGYGKSWLHRAAAFQYRLGNPEPLLSAQWLGTHNSFNSVNSEPTASHTDSNQQLSLTQQLDIDMRALELDVHYIPSLAANGAKAVVVCHGRGPDEAHFGCTNEPTLAQVLPALRDWLNAHPKQVLLLYLEDELGDPAGYVQTLDALDSKLKRPDGSSLIQRPSASEMTSKGCANLPLGTSRRAVRAAGAQVLLVGNCRSGWARDVYSWDDNHVESGSTPQYRPFPACDATYSRAVYDQKLVRYYEDSTFVATAIDPTQNPEDAGAGRLSPERVGSMTRCGVNLFGFDQVLPDDGRIGATIWSWAPKQPDAKDGGCALQRPSDGRWVTAACGARHQAACRTASGWTITPKAVTYARAKRACGGSFGLPRTGYENSLLRAAAGAGAVWIAYRLP